MKLGSVEITWASFIKVTYREGGEKVGFVQKLKKLLVHKRMVCLLRLRLNGKER